jgi:hypothetical protein
VQGHPGIFLAMESKIQNRSGHDTIISFGYSSGLVESMDSDTLKLWIYL